MIHPCGLGYPPGGRLVAITGAGFAPDVPAWADTFTRLTESAYLVFTGTVSGAAFAKHGTSFETWISVFDKCRGGEQGGITAYLTRTPSPDVAYLMSLITTHVPPRLVLDPDARAANRPTSLFPGNPARTTRMAISPSRATPAAQATSQIQAENLVYTLRDATEDDASAHLLDAIYETFRLQAIDIPGAEPHPTKLVQSAAMASVAPPKPSYRPKLPAEQRRIYDAYAGAFAINPNNLAAAMEVANITGESGTLNRQVMRPSSRSSPPARR